MKDFSRGDLVKLKSGGPLMTVDTDETGASSIPRVGTVWFDKNEELQNGKFAEASLEKVQSKEHKTPIKPA